MECKKCKKEIVTAHNGTDGFAKTKDGEVICYDCCTVLDIEQMNGSNSVLVYLSMDKSKVTNWPGGVLGRVINLRKIRHVRARGEFVSFDVVDSTGKSWYGRGQPGMLCQLRARKQQPQQK